MFYILLQSLARYLGPHIDIQIFIWLQTDIQSFLKRTLIYITNQHHFLKFENIKIKLWFIFELFQCFFVIRMWSFLFLTHTDFTSDLDFIIRGKTFAADKVVGSMKFVSANQFSACTWLAKIPRHKNTNWISVASNVLFSNFQQCLFLPLPVFFLIRMLLLDLLPSELILILRFEIFLANSNNILRLKLIYVFLDRNWWIWFLNSQFLIWSNSLNIWLSCNLVTQSHGDHNSVNT